MTTTVFLAHRFEIVRRGLRAILAEDAHFLVIGEASDGLVACEQVGVLRPDLLFVDLALRGIGGSEVTERVTRNFSPTRVIALSFSPEEAHALAALRSGAYGFVTTDEPAEEILRAAREVAAGRRYLCPPFEGEPIEPFLRRARESVNDPYDTLTAREREVFHLVAEGLLSAEIAERLGISRRTAEGHRSHIKRKLGIKGQTDLLRRALLRGAIPLERRDPSREGGEPSH